MPLSSVNGTSIGERPRARARMGPGDTLTACTRSGGFETGELVEVTVAAAQRATGRSLGSICASSLIVAVSRMIGKSALIAKRVSPAVASQPAKALIPRQVTNPRTNILPGPLTFLSALTPIFSFLAGVLEQMNGYALVYVGITGEAFWPSARRAVALVGRRHRGPLLDCQSASPPLLSSHNVLTPLRDKIPL